MSQTGKSRSVSATKEGLDKVRQRRAELEQPGKPDKKGWSQEDLTAQAYVHISTVKRFLRGIPVDENSAIAIVQALGLEITEVVDPKDWNPAQQTSDAINWHEVCGKVLAQQQEFQRLRRQATERGFELNVYVPLGLVERKQQQRRRGDVPLEEVYPLTEEVITKEYDNVKFLTEVIEPEKSDRIAIIGEPGAGKTTLQEKIAVWIHENNKGLPICIPLGDLQGKSIEDYLLQIWLKAALRFIEPDALGVEAQVFASLKQQFHEGKVWLLLDGVDEMAATSPVEALATIKEQLTDWLVEARVVLTCRLNVWDANINTMLTGFETYRTLEFKSEQVEDFIRQWFTCAKESQRGEELLKKLQETGKERIRELVRNPLRLSLLCQTSYVLPVDEPLPETKAALYERFTRYFYEWKQEQHPTTRTERRQLNQALGELAKAGINSTVRFRLGENLACDVMGEGLFDLACRLGWLNLVDREAKSDEPVYAFFHPTFQEYFAACAINDWRYFLNHKNNNSKLFPNYKLLGTLFSPQYLDYSAAQKIGTWTNFPSHNNKNTNHLLKHNEPDYAYRIFEPQWKEVILLWLGREGDSEFEKHKEKFIRALVEFEDECMGFYSFHAYFLAAACIAEFRSCTQSDDIVAQIVEWSLGYSEDNPIGQAAMAALSDTDCIRVYNYLDELEESSKDDLDDDPSVMKKEAITLAYALLDGYNPNKPWEDDFIPTNFPNQNAESRIEIEEIPADNLKAINDDINVLIELLHYSLHRATLMDAALRLVDILPNHRLGEAVKDLKNCLSTEQFLESPTHGQPFAEYENKFYRFKCCYKVLLHCAQNLPYPDFYQAWHQTTT